MRYSRGSSGNSLLAARISADDIALRVWVLCVAAYFATSVLMSESLRHAIIFAGTMPLYYVAFRAFTESRYKAGECLSLMVVMSLLLVGYVAAENKNGYRLLYDCSRFFCLYVISTTAIRKTYSPRAAKFIAAVMMAVPAVLLMASFSGSAYVAEGGHNMSYLTLGMTHPNEAGFVILGVYGVIVILLHQPGHKLILFADAAICEYLLILTNSRTAIFASFVVTAYALFLSRVKIPKSVILGLTLTAVAFVPVYLWMYYGLGVGDFQIDPAGGKTFFSGRQHTFMEFLSLVKDSMWLILFGNLGQSAFGNAHNGPLAIMTSIGVVGLVVTYWNFVGRLLRINAEASTPESRIAVISIAALYFQSSGEAGLFRGGFMLVSFLYIYMLYAQKKIITHSQRRSEPE